MKCSTLFVCSGLFLVKRKTLKKALGLEERDDYPEQEWPEGALLVLLGYFFFFWEGPLFWLLFSICRDSIITIIKCFWRLLIFLMTTEFRNNFFSECGVVECERWHCLWYPWYQKGLTMLRVDFSIRTFLGHSELQVELRMKFLEIQQSGQQGPSLEIKINPTSSYLMTV